MPEGAAGGLFPVTLSDVRVRIGDATPLDGLDLTLAAGGVTALMGPNGAGKSLTLRLIAGLLAPNAGAVRWGGATAPPPGAVAMVFQRPVLLRRSVVANLDHALRLARVSRAARAAKRAALLDRCGLAALARRPARALSGGEQQRLALARALAFSPRLLLLDEPTASLDPQATASVEALISDAAAEGVSALLVTHDTGQARRLADRVAFLQSGRLAEDAPAAAFFDGPSSEAARAYLSGRLFF